jgi:hypothetical protein
MLVLVHTTAVGIPFVGVPNTLITESLPGQLDGVVVVRTQKYRPTIGCALRGVEIVAERLRTMLIRISIVDADTLRDFEITNNLLKP